MVLTVAGARAGELVHVSRALYGRGWMEGTAGNVSVRLDDGEHVLITASGRSKGELAERDTVLVSLADGTPVGTDQPKASAETAIHLALYRAFGNVGAVVHAHPPYATAVASKADGPSVRFDRFEIIKGLGLAEPDQVDVPVFPNWADVPRIAEDIAAHYAGIDGIGGIGGEVPPALLIAHHGATAWGATLEQARNRLESLEALCQLELIVNR